MFDSHGQPQHAGGMELHRIPFPFSGGISACRRDGTAQNPISFFMHRIPFPFSGGMQLPYSCSTPTASQTRGCTESRFLFPEGCNCRTHVRLPRPASCSTPTASLMFDSPCSTPTASLSMQEGWNCTESTASSQVQSVNQGIISPLRLPRQPQRANQFAQFVGWGGISRQIVVVWRLVLLDPTGISFLQREHVLFGVVSSELWRQGVWFSAFGLVLERAHCCRLQHMDTRFHTHVFTSKLIHTRTTRVCFRVWF